MIGKKPCPLCGGQMHRGAGRCIACRKAATQVSQAGASDSTSVNGNTSEVTKTIDRRVKTLPDLIRVCEIDTKEWEIERWVCNKWDMGSVPRAVGQSKEWSRASTTPVVTELYQVKVWLRRRVALIAVRDEIAALVADAKRTIAPRKAPAIIKSGAGLMLELAIPDAHIGKLAWAAETGHDNYDSKIAVRDFTDALDALLARTAGHKFDRVLLVVGNDLLNTDTKGGTTTAGTPQSTDSRYHKTFLVTRRMIAAAIEERLAPLARRIDVPVVPGNHDTLATWHLGDSLACYFHARTNIVIDNEPTARKYVQHGKVMLMFHHGDKIRARAGQQVSAPLLMAREQPAMWAASQFREIHVGHLHQKETSEQHGVVTRVLSALCAPDGWHADNGYVGNARAAEAFVWHRTDGLIATAHYTVPQQARRGAA